MATKFALLVPGFYKIGSKSTALGLKSNMAKPISLCRRFRSHFEKIYPRAMCTNRGWSGPTVTQVCVQKTAQYRNCSFKSNGWYTTENELTACYSTSYVGFECLIGCSTTLAFPEYPCNDLIHTCLIAVKGLQFRECCLGLLISIVAFPKVPAWVHCSTSSIHQSCSIPLSDIFLTRTATLAILSYI